GSLGRPPGGLGQRQVWELRLLLDGHADSVPGVLPGDLFCQGSRPSSGWQINLLRYPGYSPCWVRLPAPGGLNVAGAAGWRGTAAPELADTSMTIKLT